MPLPFTIEKRLYAPKEEQTKLSRTQVTQLEQNMSSRYNVVSKEIYALMTQAILDETKIGTDFDNKKGSIYKRIQKWFWDEYSFKFVAKAGTNIDSLEATIQALREDTLVFPVEAGLRRYINWQAGDFGDGGSCYFGGNSVTRRFLNTLENFRALTIWKDGKGYGRGLVLSDIGGRDIHLIWNTYPSHSNCKFQDLFASALCSNLSFVEKEPYTHKTVTLEQRNKEGWFYTNGNKGVLIYPERLQKEVDKIDKQVMAFGDRPNMKELPGYVAGCVNCGSGDGNTRAIFDYDEDIIVLDKGVVFCKGCAKNKVTCYCCGKKAMLVSQTHFAKYPVPQVAGYNKAKELVCGVCVKEGKLVLA